MTAALVTSASCPSGSALNLDRGDGTSVFLVQPVGSIGYRHSWHPVRLRRNLWAGTHCLRRSRVAHLSCFILRRRTRAKRLVLCSWTPQESAKRSWFHLAAGVPTAQCGSALVPMRLIYISPVAMRRPNHAMWLVLCSWPLVDDDPPFATKWHEALKKMGYNLGY